MIKICSFPADPSTEYHVSLVERVFVQRHPITQLESTSTSIYVFVPQTRLCLGIAISKLCSALRGVGGQFAK